MRLTLTLLLAAVLVAAVGVKAVFRAILKLVSPGNQSPFPLHVLWLYSHADTRPSKC